MPKLHSFRMFINERLTAAALEIFEAVEKTVVEYHEENERLRRMLRITPEIKLCRIDSMPFSVSEEEVPPEQQHCEQELSPSLGQEDPAPTQVKEEHGELRTSQEEEQLQGFLYTKDSMTSPCVKSECDQENPPWTLTPPQTQTEENRESDSKQMGCTPFFITNPLKGQDISCDPSVNQNFATSHMSTVHHLPTTSKQMITVEKKFSCGDCGKYFRLKKNIVAHKHIHKGTPREINVPETTVIHPDIEIPTLAADVEALITKNDEGRPDRYGALLFKVIVSEHLYHKWVRTTNWDGSRKKAALPLNLRAFIMSKATEKFPSLMTSTVRSAIKNRINEYLRTPRKSGHGVTSMM
ncbi:hypothetical protein UPYG_G00246200 [Umbra pygmaea]|uniref:C2H2-type domain-containing protein n=1 Tax=Umbra pygmaea TaxID=75934 RepID=A0ABD0WHX9_UMBPY